MRTTLDIDDDVLRASREIARREKTTAGKVLSDLARRGLRGTVEEASESTSFLGFEPFPHRGGVVTNADIDVIREEGEY
jgi:hypothetical protein